MIFVEFFSDKFIKSEDNKKTEIFIFWNGGTVLFYIGLIIFSYINSRIYVGLYFLLGLISGIIAFIVELIRKQPLENEIFTFGFIMVEVIFLIGSIFYAQNHNKLMDKKTFVNLLTIDTYKYMIILFIPMIILTIAFMILAFLCSGFCSNSSGSSGTSGYSGSYDSSVNSYYEESSKKNEKKEKKKPKEEEPPSIAWRDQNGHYYDKNYKWIG